MEPVSLSSPAALPADEVSRQQALRDLEVLDSEAESMFDDIARLAALICKTPIALLSLVDAERQWFKARVGLQAQETPRDMAFCAHAILQPDHLFTVGDASADPRFATNPLVTGDPGIRFYAGMPVVTELGHAVGTVCVIDRQPRQLDPPSEEALRALARQAGRLLAWRKARALERSHWQGEAQQQRERLRNAAALAANAQALMLSVERQGLCGFVSDRCLDVWARPRAEIEGQPVLPLLQAAGVADEALALIERAFQGETAGKAVDLQVPGLGRRRMNLNTAPVRDESGAVVSVVMRADDVHELERARAELALANERLLQRQAVQQRFIHMVSHDLREPVNSICNFSGLLVDEHAQQLDATGRRHLGFVHQGGQRMRALLDSLLAYVQLDSHEGSPLPLQVVALDEVRTAVLADLSAAIQSRQAQVHAESLPVVHAHPALVRVLFQNLVSNALKFHAPGVPPVVHWSAEPRDGGFAIHVRDQGIGIPASQQARLFGTFTRLVTRQQYEGTGLGLAICRRIADLHGGSITVASAPDHGSTFTVWLRPPPSPGARDRAALAT